MDDNETRFVSLANWNLITSWNIYTWDNLLWKEFIVRKSMVKITDAIDEEIDDEISTNWAEYNIYKVRISKLDTNSDSDYIKQLAFKININNTSWTNNIVLKDFKIDLSNDNNA